MAEEKIEPKFEQKTKSKINPWMVSTLVLVVIVLVVVGFSLTGKATAGAVPSGEIGNKVKAYVEDNLLPTGGTIDVINVSETNGVYLITTSYQGREIPIYMTKDGKYMFLSAVDITKPVEQPEETSSEIPKTDKPTVELFVMSFCPYGVQAENAMKPAYDLLKNVTDFKVRFIVNVGGNTTSSVQSLHGAAEAQEDLRQICIQKYYPDKYWDYLMEINKNCYSIYRDPTAMDACWKAAATKFGIDIKKIETCANSTEGLTLLKADEQITERYGVSGSPTLIINGVQYSGSRTSEAYKQGICGAFNTAPAACGQSLGNSTSAEAPAGGCA